MSWRNNTEQSALPRGGRRNRGRPAPQGATTQLTTRQMEHIASVSRSSGLEKDGDTQQYCSLKGFKVQNEYRQFLQGKLDGCFKKHPRRPKESELESRQRIDAQENVLILFRKLREGISSSGRQDPFALEVYETSLYLSVLFNSPKQTTSIIPHLLPGLYLGLTAPHRNCLVTILVSLVHYLVAAYPSQGVFAQQLKTIPTSLMPRASSAFKWIKSLSQSLRTLNYTKFEELTRPSHISRSFEDPVAPLGALPLSQDGQPANLPLQALIHVVDALRHRAQATFWNVIRSAYREISITGSGDWLKRSLCLQRLVPYEVDTEAEEWFETHLPLGHVQHKEGAADRWLILKIR